ncbi:MAG: M24 family metallopeptidase C-terminal domain-containing protein, partial [Bradyrhizobium sp.]
GYYKTDGYGIRIENLELVIAADMPGAEKSMNAFDALTLAPIDRRLIEAGMLSAAERDWLDAYHARVRREIRGQLDDATKAWLDQATAQLAP